MAASAYATAVSLMQVLDNIQQPARQHLHFDRDQIETLLEKVSFFLGFLEDYSQILGHTDTQDLGRQIAYAFDEAEEVIDCHVVDQLSQRSAYNVDMGLSSFREDIERVLDKIESIKKELMVVKDREAAVKDLQPKVSLSGSLAPPSNDKINTMVGFDEHLVRIMDQLTRDESGLQIVSITGMGGIGKTTLAQNVFDNHRIVNHFDQRKWITISQSYNIHDVLLRLVGKLNSNQTSAELGGELHKMLFGRRYLIVMDDVWSTQVWDKLGLFIPNNRNGSRIIVTTRLSNVAVSLGSHNPYLMDFLGKKESWKLFCIKAFGKEVCPNPELEKIGRNIVKGCKGLPLAIAVIGGLLRKSNMTREDWEIVAKDVIKSLANSKDDEDCLSILSLSYKHLPIHLKPCFLYLRVFPEDAMIYVDELIEYWIAEGFVKPKGGKTLEEVAHEYLIDLSNRNLILIRRQETYNGEIWSCKVHDLLRDLCIREYENEHFFGMSKVQKSYLEQKRSLGSWKVKKADLEPDTCLLCCYRTASTNINPPQVSTNTGPLSTRHANCFVCNICSIMCSQNNRLRWVKVADYHGVEYLRTTRLRYLKVSRPYKFESTVLPLLWNLQFLDFEDNFAVLPFGICEMPQLRHVNVPRHVLNFDPQITQILENLHTLSDVRTSRCSEEIILKRIPNVRKLGLSYSKQAGEVLVPPNLVDLHKLDDLTCRGISLEHITFPNSLKILHLENGNCPWERMTIIGSLPKLEMLKLVNTVGGGPEWNPVEGEFLRLHTLVIAGTELAQWNAEKNHFPKLEILQFVVVYYLENIPSSIGEIETLRQIWLTCVSESVVQSAQEIIEEQRSYGNEDLQLIIK